MARFYGIRATKTGQNLNDVRSSLPCDTGHLAQMPGVNSIYTVDAICSSATEKRGDASV